MWAKVWAFLASCRRIVLLLTFCLVAFFSWLYWHAPSFSEMRPELETLLKVQLHLKEVRLGQLSWYWNGHTWVTAENVSFISGGGRLQVKGAQLAVRLSTWDLLSGRITPTAVTVRHGHVSAHIPEDVSVAPFAPPSMKLNLEDVDLAWWYGRMNGEIHHLKLRLDGEHRTLKAIFPDGSIDLALSRDMALASAKMKFRDISWLPAGLRQYVHGQAGGEISLRREQARRWQAHLALHGTKGPLFLVDSAAQRVGGMDTLEARLQVDMVQNAFQPEQIELQSVDWHLGKDVLKLSGNWQAGKLHLKLDSGSLGMTQVWSRLTGLGEKDWQAWLRSMHAGRAEDMTGDLDMDYPDLLKVPDRAQLRLARYHLHSKVHDADITLGSSTDQLTHVNGVIDLDDHGLQAHADQALLPNNAGSVKGTFAIRDWNHIAFDIQGTGEVDASLLQSWLGAGHLPNLNLAHSPSTGLFSFHWLPEEKEPRQGSITLKPSQAWDGEWRGIPVQLSGGEVHWSMSKGLSVKAMHVQFPIVSGDFDMGLAQGKGGIWQLSHLRAGFSADFPKVVAKYRFPLDAPTGRIRGKLAYDGSWQGSVDFGAAAWHHLLGGNKQEGEALVLHFAGMETARGMQLKTIRADGAGLHVKGNGVVGPSQVYLNLAELKAPAYDGTMQITVPISKAVPLEVNARVKFMDRQALPDQIPHAISDRPWVLRATIKRLHWDAALLQGVDIKLASSGHGVGLLQADSLDSSNLHVSNVKAFFRLPGKGKVDLRSLTAQLLGQRLSLSATISPAPGNGISWQGFATIDGEFSQVIKRLDASKLFKGGTVHALISGQGLLLPDKPWWKHLHGRLRLRADDGRVLEGGTMTKLLAASSLSDLLRYLTLSRKDLTGPGMLYKHLQLEASLDGGIAHIRRLAMRASAMDMAGKGSLRLDDGDIDMVMVVRPLQNLDAILGAIPLLRDILGGASRSLMRLVYHVYGPLPNAKVKQVTPEEAGLAAPGLLESLITLPQRWFTSDVKGAPAH